MENSNTNNQEQKVWVYDGIPEYVAINIEPTLSVQGGYVLALKLTSDVVRIAATRNPSKYVTTWRRNAKCYGAPDVARVLVAGPFLRYEAVKRTLVSRVAQYKDQGADVYRLPHGVDDLTAMIMEVGAVAGVCFRGQEGGG